MSTPGVSVSEAFRSLRTNTQYTLDGIESPVIAVTSSQRSEGKSTTSLNLAAAYAQEGRRTLLIDANLRNPVLHTAFGITNRTGLTQVLAEGTPIDTCTMHSGIDRLNLLTSGPTPYNPSELLASRRMDELLENARKKYEIVIIDTPSLLEVTDSQLIASKCDGILLVIRSGKVKQSAAVKAKELLIHVKANVLGFVLNGA
ncbi:CpsD/CapB family tyrosine-protein kinase [Cohnella panacarvi]|uniref:CpsD/CapB family tyrosine-protein kinase n=1 Tax=Cohnella panacarvi TaxID=400776 RepID=UPI001FE20D64|nr:CpsD/CapB family tyrosine-protein kinase [Cohnella panacarvi]